MKALQFYLYERRRGYLAAAGMLSILTIVLCPAETLHQLALETPIAVFCLFGGFILGAGPVIDWAFRALQKGNK